ncbi:CTP synthetase [Halobacteriales archaeon SW_8_65_20]|nr:MAG: CTP synthetase [Halobacteriales archaeon QH_7_65_31]PSQ30563.1 MAG: CTP synthetase [Halobacteriales archaeon SW_6_65_46]PSQ51351.1 MAG: CTP synthetase [Halobacteriales archaeon SW_8_65_20]
MTRAVIAGSDAARLGPALTTEGVDVTTAAGTANRDALEAAGIDEADVLVVTETTLATAIPVAKELNPDVRVVVYADGSLPDFARRQAGHILDPKLLDPDFVAEEVAAA